MKNKRLIIIIVVFFLLLNTSYYWEGKLGLFAFPFFLLLAMAYLWLSIALLRQIYLTIKEKFKQRERFIVIGLLTTVLLLTFYKPSGLVDFDKLEGDDLLVAERTGSANCLTTLKLKDDFSFRERIGCFGVTEIEGTFRVIKDTIYFSNIQPGRYEDNFYKFAVIRPSSFDNPKILGELIRYKDITDTIGHELWITKNELQRIDTTAEQPTLH
ncbi:hypothetical protein QTN47_21455 [Danxiaibacter flavus]|uniref:DUF4131 domain-containing protein n=1 Tax=Danxiaibacter flavus TaxID=3049108 RepID=A0ABV3ZKU5_9BACT